MGLTIHYSFHAPTKSVAKAAALVQTMHRLISHCKWLHVAPVVSLTPAQLDETPSQYRDVPLPWSRGHLGRLIPPTDLHEFTVDPDFGCEGAGFGLVAYPATVSVPYRPIDDARFWRDKEDPTTFDEGKWDRRVHRTLGPGAWIPAQRPTEDRAVRTGLKGWYYHDFCKTEFACNPRHGGSLLHFLKCHILLVHFLDRLSKLPGLTVEYYDEAEYGSYVTHAATDDLGVRAVMNEGHYDVEALARQVGFVDSGCCKQAMDDMASVLEVFNHYGQFCPC